mgnify:CR=1 FL=1
MLESLRGKWVIGKPSSHIRISLHEWSVRYAPVVEDHVSEFRHSSSGRQLRLDSIEVVHLVVGICEQLSVELRKIHLSKFAEYVGIRNGLHVSRGGKTAMVYDAAKPVIFGRSQGRVL